MNCTAFLFYKITIRTFLLITFCAGQESLFCAAQVISQQVAQAAGQAVLQATQNQAQANAQDFLQRHKMGILKGFIILTTTGVIIATGPLSLPAIGVGALKGLFWGFGIAEIGDRTTRKLFIWQRTPAPDQQPASHTTTPTAQTAQPTINVTIPNYPVTEFNTISYRITAVETDLRRFKRATKKKFAQVDQRMDKMQQQIIFLAKAQLLNHQAISRLSDGQLRTREALPSDGAVVEPVED